MPNLPPVDPTLWLTTGQMVSVAHVPQQTLITWDRNGILKAKSRPGVRTSSRAPRRYDEHGVTAAIFASEISQMGFAGKPAFREMVQLVQEGDRIRLRRAGIFTYRSYPGLMKHIYSPDLKGADDRRYIAWLRDRDALIEHPTDLWTIRVPIFEFAYKLMTNPSLREGPGFLGEQR